MAPDYVPDWLAVGISLVALGWTIKEGISTRRELRVQERRAQMQMEQQEYRSLLDSFLLPLSASLARSRRDFESLATGHAGEVHRLEYFPGRLRSHFESLPDARRLFWRVEINQLHDHNAQAIRLIDDFASRSRLSPEFQSGCESFRRHALKWKAVWDAASDPSIPAEQLPSEVIADPFPKDFDLLVAQEVASVRIQVSA